VIVLDTSALLAVLLREPEREAVYPVLKSEVQIAISAVTLAEILIVSLGREITDQANELLASLDPLIYPITETRARVAARCYEQWGKGFHKAKLNYCDCFAYALAVELECPLLYIGNDFALTDITSALA
jgi:ribonuclease VapC